jgi:hypothetical protein
VLTNEIAVMERVMEADSAQVLKRFEFPVREIAEATKLKIDRGRIQKVLDESPLKYAANEFAKSSTGLDNALAALEWLGNVRRLVTTPLST